ncbi:MAG: amidase domain-containing protein, partial [Candidatus Dormiibacterota bacterium]
TRYAVSVTAVNPVGPSEAATGTAVPEAVPGGTQKYVEAVDQLLNADDALQMGTHPTAEAVTASDSQRSLIAGWLTNQAPGYTAMAAYATANHQQDVNDQTKLSNVLVSSDPTGSTVNVYATATETFTTVDTKTSIRRSIPGSQVDNVDYSFSTGASPAVINYTDANAVLVPVSLGDSSTAHSTALDASPSKVPAPVATNPAGTGFATTPSGLAVPMVNYGNLTGIANWANANWNGTNNGFSNDCTDFASRAMHYGGGMPENVAVDPLLQKSNDAYWYQYTYWYGLTVESYSWAGAYDLANYEAGQGAYFYSYIDQVQPGDIIWANWTGSNASGISHTGVVVANYQGNLYIDQHTYNRYYEPLYKVAGVETWQGDNPNLTVWVAQPYENN